MGLILLEALLALVLLVAIVWWTMFSGRKGGELQPSDQAAPAPNEPDAPPPAAPGASVTPPAPSSKPPGAA
ncbi:hypothetical protein [Acidovorax sp. sic0104]|uniref:hypothetical protein n=1 Tax=Acidovorax sp. sic0104 TaxID=2854784 RepID=UPI001C44F9EA|nr:hypothetical protein [Acidovorax sp. sic0104]MBV7541574.1 hypothetical protein [Acidovorax sp. sic0104]